MSLKNLKQFFSIERVISMNRILRTMLARTDGIRRTYENCDCHPLVKKELLH